MYYFPRKTIFPFNFHPIFFLTPCFPQVVRVAVSKLRRVQLSLVQPVLRPWLLAAEAGKRGERCGASYRYCGDTRYGDKLRLQLATW